METFSELDGTTNLLSSNVFGNRNAAETKRPTKEKNSPISLESIILIVFGFIGTGIGIIVYNHSNRFVSVEKDIEYIKVDVKDQKDIIQEVDVKTNKIDGKLDLLNQKVDLSSENYSR